MFESKASNEADFNKTMDAPFWALTSLCFLMFICLLLQIGCATKKIKTLGTKSFDELIAQNTRQNQKYDGFYNKFEAHATFLNSEVQTALLQKKSEVLNWDAKQIQTERERLFQENSNQTKFSMSFFTPSVRLNDLHKKTSIWRVYLDVGGKRYDGKVMRRNGTFEDIQALFNYHTRWDIAYDVVFSLPLSGVEGQGPISFVLTSTQGTAALTFQ